MRAENDGELRLQCGSFQPLVRTKLRRKERSSIEGPQHIITCLSPSRLRFKNFYNATLAPPVRTGDESARKLPVGEEQSVSDSCDVAFPAALSPWSVMWTSSRSIRRIMNISPGSTPQRRLDRRRFHGSRISARCPGPLLRMEALKCQSASALLLGPPLQLARSINESAALQTWLG